MKHKIKTKRKLIWTVLRFYTTSDHNTKACWSYGKRISANATVCSCGAKQYIGCSQI